MNLTSFANRKDADSPHYLLLGHPVGHSWSPLMHNTALKHYGIRARYHALDLQNQELADLAAFMNREPFRGANITIPYKQLITDYLDEVDPEARKIGAVNTIVSEGHHLKGFNTDCPGFIAPLEDYSGDIYRGRAIVFGTGGASRAIVAGLEQLGVKEIYLVSRTPQQITSFDEFEHAKIVSYHQWTSYSGSADLIVNATPLGMHPKTEQSPVRDSEMQQLASCICYDIVYNPLETKFLRQAKRAGAATIAGLEMLIHQGSRAFELWTGRPFPIEIVKEKLHERLTN